MRSYFHVFYINNADKGYICVFSLIEVGGGRQGEEEGEREQEEGVPFWKYTVT